MIACEEDEDAWCDVYHHDVVEFPSMINFAGGRETLTGSTVNSIIYRIIGSDCFICHRPRQMKLPSMFITAIDGLACLC